MRSRSFQQSLYQEILGGGEQFSSVSPSQFFEQQNSDLFSSAIVKNITNNHSRTGSLKDLEDQIIKMQVQANKNRNSALKKQRHILKESRNNTEGTQGQTSSKMRYSVSSRRSSCEGSLYEKCMKEQSQKKHKIDKKIREKEDQELSLCTYHPQINETSQAIIQRLDRQSITIRKKEKVERKMKKTIEQQQQKALKQCSFKPNINKNYKQKKQEGKNVFNSLYEESKGREQRLKVKHQKYLNNIVKAPIIDSVSKDITENTTFEERLQKYEQQKQYKMLKRKVQEEKQNTTLYKPKINQTYCMKNTDRQQPIGDYLYSQSRRKNLKQGKKQQKSNSNVNKKSQKVYEEKKIMAFYKIFMILDDDDDSLISINSINLGALPREIIKILYPLLEELQVMQVELCENQFIESICKLFKTLSIHERNTLLSINNKEKQYKDNDFQPKINEKSKQIAQQIQRSRMNIYDYCSIKQTERKKQIQSERIEKGRKQLKQCTFQPKIISHFQY